MNAVIHVAGLTLLHFVWQGTLLALVAAASLRLLRDASPQSRYAAACIVLAAMLAAPVATIQVLSAPAPLEIVARGSQKTPTIGAAPTTETGTGTSAPERRESPTPNLTHGILPFVVGIWAAGVVLLLARLAGGWWRVSSRHRAALGMAVSPWQATVERTASVLRLRRRVLCVDSALVDTPTVIGWLRPVILLPIAALANLTPAQVEAILAHELAHVRRHDYIVNLLQNVTETLLFYHPGVWWVSKRIRAEREHCCDEIAVKIHGDTVGYVAALAELEAWRTQPSALAVTATGGSLLDRVHRLLRVRDDGESPASYAALTAALIALIIVAGGSRYFPTQADTGAPSMQVQAAPRTNWQIHETPHFDVLYAQGSNADVEGIAREVERAYDRSRADLGHDLSIRPYLVVFGTRRELEQGLPVGDFPQGRHRILLSLDVRAEGVSSLLRHEVAHSFFFDIVPREASAIIPSWISEGLAEYMRGDWIESDREALSNLVRRNSVPQVSRLTSSSFSDSPRLNYVIGHAAFDFIVSRWNTDGLRRFLLSLRQLGASANVDGALRSAFGVGPDVFDRDLARYLTVRFAAPQVQAPSRQPETGRLQPTLTGVRLREAGDPAAAELARLQSMLKALRSKATQLRQLPPAKVSTEAPAFEASVRKNNSGDRRTFMQLKLRDGQVAAGTSPGGQFHLTNATVRMLIQNAYRNQSPMIVGGPSWIDSDRFDLTTTADRNLSIDDVPLMMQAVLRERFKLVVRWETRELPVQEQPGLGSESQRGPVEVLVIESIDHPSEDQP